MLLCFLDPNNSFIWIGATDTAHEGVFRWTSDLSEINENTFMNWNNYEPNNGAGSGVPENCVFLTENRQWNDVLCSGAVKFLCQFTTTRSMSHCLKYGAERRCYKFVNERKSMADANAYCGSNFGGNLAEVANSEIDEFVSLLIQGML